MSSTSLASSSFVLGTLFISSVRFLFLSISLPKTYKTYLRDPLKEFLNKDLQATTDEEKAEARFKTFHLAKGSVSTLRIPLSDSTLVKSKKRFTEDILHLLPLTNFFSVIFSLLSFISLLAFPSPDPSTTKILPSCTFLIALSVLSFNIIRILVLTKIFFSIKRYSDRVRKRLLTSKDIPKFSSINSIETGAFWAFIFLRLALSIVLTSLDTGVVKALGTTGEGTCSIRFDIPSGSVMLAADLFSVLYLMTRWVMIIWETHKLEVEGNLGGVVEEGNRGSGWRKIARDLFFGRWEMIVMLVMGIWVISGAAGWLGKGGVEAFWIPQTLSLLFLLYIINFSSSNPSQTSRSGDGSISTLNSANKTISPDRRPQNPNFQPRHFKTASSSFSSIARSTGPPPTPAPTGPLPPIPFPASPISDPRSATLKTPSVIVREPSSRNQSKGKKEAFDFSEEMLAPMTTKNQTTGIRKGFEVDRDRSTTTLNTSLYPSDRALNILPGPGSEDETDKKGILNRMSFSNFRMSLVPKPKPIYNPGNPSLQPSNSSNFLRSPRSDNSSITSGGNQSEEGIGIISKARLVGVAKKIGMLNKTVGKMMNKDKEVEPTAFSISSPQFGSTAIVEPNTNDAFDNNSSSNGVKITSLSSYNRPALSPNQSSSSDLPYTLPSIASISVSTLPTQGSSLPSSIKPASKAKSTNSMPPPTLNRNQASHLSQISERTEPSDPSTETGISLPKSVSISEIDAEIRESLEDISNYSTMLEGVESVGSLSNSNNVKHQRESSASSIGARRSKPALTVDTSLKIPTKKINKVAVGDDE